MKNRIKLFLGIISVSPILFLLSIAFSFILFRLYPAQLIANPEIASGVSIFGTVLILIGTILAFTAQRISRVVTSPKYKATCPDLMQGPYAYSRHPGTLSLIIMYVGFTLVVNSFAAMVFTLLLIVILSTVFVPAQEKVISELCPEAYAEYKKKVRMWI